MDCQRVDKVLWVILVHCHAVAKVYWVFARVLLIESCLQKNYFAFYTYLEKSSNYIFLLLGTIFSKKKKKEKRRKEKYSHLLYRCSSFMHTQECYWEMYCTEWEGGSWEIIWIGIIRMRPAVVFRLNRMMRDENYKSKACHQIQMNK